MEAYINALLSLAFQSRNIKKDKAGPAFREEEKKILSRLKLVSAINIVKLI